MTAAGIAGNSPRTAGAFGFGFIGHGNFVVPVITEGPEMNGIEKRSDEDWVVVSTYTREQAIEDGVLVDASEMAKEAGFVYPVALTRAVWERYVEVPAAVSWQDQTGRLWDILWMLRVQIARNDGGPELHFELVVQNEPGEPKPVTLKAVCGPGDDIEPVITVMLPEED